MNRLHRAFVCVVVLWLLPAACHAEKYALLIGLDKYSKGADKLDSCIADLHGVAAALQANCGYRPENIQLLAGEDKTKVTRQEILDAVAQLAARIHPDDTVFFFWSGHGIYLEGQDRVLPYDGDWSSLDGARRRTLPVQEMLAPLLQVRSKAVMLFFNICREDAFAQIDHYPPSTVVPLSPQPVQATTETIGPQLKVSLYSSTKGQLSWMWSEKHRSFFGYCLEQGLRGAAADAKGEIHIENLVGYLRIAVPATCWRMGRALQRPYVVTSSPEALRLTLASGLPPGKGGATAVPMTIGDSVDERFDAVFQAGAEQWFQQHYEEARAKFEEAVNLKPENAESVLALADTDKHLKRLDEAERYYRQGLKIWPKLGTIVSRLAEVLVLRKDNDGAEKLYRQAVARSPKQEAPVLALADFYADVKHDDATALELYRQAVKLDSADPYALIGLGTVYLRLKNPDKAEAIFRKIMEVHSDNAHAVGNLASRYESVKKDIPGAERLYLQAIALDPTLAWVQYDLGRLYYQDKKDSATAEKYFRKAMELDPNENDSILMLASLNYERKDYVASEALDRKVLERDPRNVMALCRIGSIRFSQANYPEAEKYYRQALETDPKYAYATNGLANVCWARKEYKAAEDLYRKAIELDGSQGMFHCKLAECLVDDNQKDAALVEAKKALEMGYKDSWVFVALGLTPQ